MELSSTQSWVSCLEHHPARTRAIVLPAVTQSCRDIVLLSQEHSRGPTVLAGQGHSPIRPGPQSCQARAAVLSGQGRSPVRPGPQSCQARAAVLSGQGRSPVRPGPQSCQARAAVLSGQGRSPGRPGPQSCQARAAVLAGQGSRIFTSAVEHGVAPHTRKQRVLVAISKLRSAFFTGCKNKICTYYI